MTISGENKKINTEIDIELISNLFRSAEEENRKSLYEHETNDMLKGIFAGIPPASILLENHLEYSDEELMSIPGDRVVLKIVSPHITHKTDVGGIKIVDKSAENIREALRQMIVDIPKKYALKVEKGTLQEEDYYKGLSNDVLRDTVYDGIKGVLLAQYISPESKGFGNELLAGIRNAREFGPIISAGMGGTDTELFADTLRKGQAFVTASSLMTTGEEFLNIFKQTVSYKKLAGLTSGQQPVAIDDRLTECFSSFISLANFYSQTNSDAPYIIEELEVNPFVHCCCYQS